MAAAKGSTDTQSHVPFSTSDPGALAATQAATAAGMAAAQQRYGHYEANTHGLAATCGDPMPAETTQQPQIVPPEPRSTT